MKIKQKTWKNSLKFFCHWQNWLDKHGKNSVKMRKIYLLMYKLSVLKWSFRNPVMTGLFSGYPWLWVWWCVPFRCVWTLAFSQSKGTMWGNENLVHKEVGSWYQQVKSWAVHSVDQVWSLMWPSLPGRLVVLFGRFHILTKMIKVGISRK